MQTITCFNSESHRPQQPLPAGDNHIEKAKFSAKGILPYNLALHNIILFS